MILGALHKKPPWSYIHEPRFQPVDEIIETVSPEGTFYDTV